VFLWQFAYHEKTYLLLGCRWKYCH